ncbi:protein of unknown function [Robiginitalea myxolifaciens]|uniref:NikM domain containing protein n=2 Tax=Robiginitalea myxolifaciens TaxID=400055 RepID=A0A1I6FMY3_9FLAO|nr:protein of unknown function [Robiginitalea myxolifaciens]
MSTTTTNLKRFALGLCALVLLTSHDMFLKLDGFFLEPGTPAEIELFNGTFEKSENVITRDRMLDVSLVGNGNRIAVDTADWYEKDSVTILRFTSGDPGTWVAGVSTAARNIEMAAEDFNNYLEHDGVLDMIQQRTENGTLGQDAVESYSKHVKTIFQVGDSLTEDWKTELGYPIEFVPLENPYEIHKGHQLPVKLLFQGKPLANQLVYVGKKEEAMAHGDAASGEHTHDDGTTHSHDEPAEHTHDDGTTHSHGGEEHSHNEPAEHTHDDGTTHSHDDEEAHTHTEGVQQLRTNDQGELTVEIDASGVWYLRTIHLVTVEEEGLTHESNWATLTFAIGEGHDHAAEAHEHGEDTHSHEDEGLPSWIFWLGSIVLVLILFFVFNRKK